MEDFRVTLFGVYWLCDAPFAKATIQPNSIYCNDIPLIHNRNLNSGFGVGTCPGAAENP
jgi:hypothetical protein